LEDTGCLGGVATRLVVFMVHGFLLLVVSDYRGRGSVGVYPKDVLVKVLFIACDNQ
jgi:hypothetical protein